MGLKARMQAHCRKRFRERIPHADRNPEQVGDLIRRGKFEAAWVWKETSFYVVRISDVREVVIYDWKMHVVVTVLPHADNRTEAIRGAANLAELKTLCDRFGRERVKGSGRSGRPA